MDTYQNARIKWPYVTHLIDHRVAAGVLPRLNETNAGSVVLARVVTIGMHRDLETHEGRRMSLFEGDVFAGVLGNHCATGPFEAEARCEGPFGHIVGSGGVCGTVVGTNGRTSEPTVVEWLGRLADADGRPLHLSAFRFDPGPTPATRPTTILSLGASMRSGKTTTAAQIIRSLTRDGHRVAAAKITGTACRKDPNLLDDAGAVAVLDFTYAGWPSTAGCSREELLAIASDLRRAAAAHQPEFVILEIAHGIVQREARLLLEDGGFRRSIDAVTFAGPDALSCDAGVRRLRELDYHVLATAGPVANGRLGIAEAEAACRVRCLSGEAILAGELVSELRALRGGSRRKGTARPVFRRPTMTVLRSTPDGATRARPRPAVAWGTRVGSLIGEG